MPNLTEGQRMSTLKTAQSFFDFAKSCYPAKVHNDLEKAWNSELEHGIDFGWPSFLFETIRHRKFFRDPTEDELRNIMALGEKKCPRCGGVGTLPTPTKKGSVPDIPAERIDNPTCPDCKGTGRAT